MTSALAFATPAAIVPIPVAATNLTPILTLSLFVSNRKLIELNLL